MFPRSICFCSCICFSRVFRYGMETSNADKALPPDSRMDWSEFPCYFVSPPSSPFHGFDDIEHIGFERMERERKEEDQDE